MISLILLAQLSAPTPTNVKRWVIPDDTPVEIMPENVLQTVAIRITTNPAGKLQDCTVEVSSGNPKLDDHTCRLVSRRARFRPALDSAGRQTYGVFRTGFSWWVGDDFPPVSPPIPDVQLTVSALPKKLKSPVNIDFMFSVDETGHLSACTALSKKTDPNLVQLGCQGLVKSYKAIPAKTPEGAAVSSIQTGAVLFRK